MPCAGRLSPEKRVAILQPLVRHLNQCWLKKINLISLFSRVHEIGKAEDALQFVLFFNLSQVHWKLKTSLNKLQSSSSSKIPGEAERVFVTVYCPKIILFTEAWYHAEGKNSKNRLNEGNRKSCVSILFSHYLLHTLNTAVKCTKYCHSYCKSYIINLASKNIFHQVLYIRIFMAQVIIYRFSKFQ